MSTQYGDADLTPPQGFARPEDPDGFTVAPAVIGGDLPEPPPAPGPANPGPAHAGPEHAGRYAGPEQAGRPYPGPQHAGPYAGPEHAGQPYPGQPYGGPPPGPQSDRSEPPAKRSFLGKLLRRNG
ncbi:MULTISPECIES: hypothetical protein [unclassified Saccharothrix]|uniref:hypothetical protein n=1 Tax=unclassified Saccharothrix TaxID=2593673 RepID=UPI00307E61C7